jgi:hypothetical protein
VLDVFEKSRDPEGAEILLDAWRRAGRRQWWLAYALGMLGRTEAIPDLVAFERLHPLAALGEPGCRELHRFVIGEARLGLRAEALHLLEKAGHRIPFEDVEDLFRDLAADRIDEYAWGLSAFARALAWFDRRRAAPLVKGALLAAEFPE